MLLEELKTQYLNTSVFTDEDILILDDFLENWENIKKFNEKYYKDSYPKTVLCGINPGKNGAGKTGIPFIDFSSLSELLEGVEKTGTERSAQFFYDVVKEIGAERFYRSFYVTNISWLGFIKDGKNVNYYTLSDKAKAFIYKMFEFEMNQVSPTTIISMSGEVKQTLSSLFNGGQIDISNSLPHPNYCAFPKNYSSCKSQYIELLSKYLQTAHKIEL